MLAISGSLFSFVSCASPAQRESQDAVTERDTVTADASVSGSFPAHWQDGTTCPEPLEVQTWQYAAGTYMLRQSLCTNFEGPFVHLLFGSTRALLLDTGTGDANIRSAVDAVVDQYVRDHHLPSTYALVVAHTHAHSDHVGGDSQFRGRAQTTVVGHSATQVAAFFSLTGWPNNAGTFDLGDRVLDVIPIPGHEASHIALYDRQTQVLYTGDTLYPGRLYIESWTQFQRSTARLAAFAASHTIAWALGAHIEMNTTPGHDYAMYSAVHPNEHVPQLPANQIGELNTATQAMGSTPHKDVHDQFIIYP
jgi:glyoxylase-like metal-dependent hydrolase (beta-lactamase superfamily II)